MVTANPSDLFFGCYARFETVDKKAGAALVGPDNAVGDIGEIVWDTDSDKHQQAWLQNPYGDCFAFLDKHTSYKLAIYRAKGWIIKYVLSFTAYSEQPDPGVYWGQAAIIAYPKRYEETFSTFLQSFAHATGEGLRPDPELNPSLIQQILNDPQSWKPSQKVKFPKDSKGTVILKDHRSLHDKLLDQGRQRNIGCFIASWVFLLGVVALIAYVAHIFGLF